MSIEYLGLSEINGPLVVLEGVRDASYDEIVELSTEGKKKAWKNNRSIRR
jgi:V/A-type H+/Na+-transporting ATPase subunit B